MQNEQTQIILSEVAKLILASEERTTANLMGEIKASEGRTTAHLLGEIKASEERTSGKISDLMLKVADNSIKIAGVDAKVTDLKTYTKDGFEALNDKIDNLESNIKDEIGQKQGRLEYA